MHLGSLNVQTQHKSAGSGISRQHAGSSNLQARQQPQRTAGSITDDLLQLG
jgi:hypothetical protein